MSYIPDIRSKTVPHLYENTKGAVVREDQENGYWQGFLDDKGVHMLSGFDMATDEALDVVRSSFLDPSVLRELGIQTKADDICSAISTYADRQFESVPNQELHELPLETRILLFVLDALETRLEMLRDDLGVSLIEDMNEEEYEHIRTEVKSGVRTTRYTN